MTADNIKTARGDDQYMLRLPAGMRDEIKASADANGRSMNAEIVSRLVGQQSLRDRFAGQCISNSVLHLASYISEASEGFDIKTEAFLLASAAYELADAMIAARKAGA